MNKEKTSWIPWNSQGKRIKFLLPLFLILSANADSHDVWANSLPMPDHAITWSETPTNEELCATLTPEVGKEFEQFCADIEKVTTTLQIQVDTAMEEFDTLLSSISAEEQTLILTEAQKILPPEFQPVQAWIGSMIDSLRDLWRENWLIAFLILIILWFFIWNSIWTLLENLWPKASKAINKYSRKIWFAIWSWMSALLWYFLLKEELAPVFSQLKEIKLFKHIPRDIIARAIPLLILWNLMPLAKKAPRYIKFIVVSIWATLLSRNISIEPGNAIVNKRTGNKLEILNPEKEHERFDIWEPQWLWDSSTDWNNGRKFDMYENLGWTWTDGGSTPPENLTAEQQKELKKLVKKINKNQETLIRKIWHLWSITDIESFRVDTETPRECKITYTQKIVNKDTGTPSPDTATYTFHFRFDDEQIITFTITADASWRDNFSNIDIGDLLARYGSYEDQKEILEKIKGLLTYASDCVNNHKKNRFSKKWGNQASPIIITYRQQ